MPMRIAAPLLSLLGHELRAPAGVIGGYQQSKWVADRLVTQAHARGIGVIIDYVINHSAADHPLFRHAESSPKSPWRDWYVWEKDKPEGKLRLMYEGNPLAMVVEQAGGKATTGTMRILDVEPKALHQRVPLIIGSAEDVSLAEDYVQGRA